MSLLRSTFDAIGRLLTRFWITILAVLVGIGLPVLWIWIGSQFQDGTGPSWAALTIVHAGLVSSLIIIAALFSWFIARQNRRESSGSARVDWMRGMTEGRRSTSVSTTHPLELVIIVAVVVDLIAFLVWFFFFADPGTPFGQG